MILHFLRHAQAEPMHSGAHQHDRDRRLTPEGREIMKRAARGFLKTGMQFDRILSSPYPRALESAKIVSDVFGFKHEIHLSDNLVPEALFHKFRKELLNSWTEFNSLLIVTHQPFVSECISFFLTGKDAPIAIDMGTATLCTLEIDSSLNSFAILSSMVRAEAAAWMGEAAGLKKG